MSGHYLYMLCLLRKHPDHPGLHCYKIGYTSSLQKRIGGYQGLNRVRH